MQKFMSQILLSYLSYDHVSNAYVGMKFDDFVFENQCSSNEVPKGKVTKKSVDVLRVGTTCIGHM